MSHIPGTKPDVVIKVVLDGYRLPMDMEGWLIENVGCVVDYHDMDASFLAEGNGWFARISRRYYAPETQVTIRFDHMKDALLFKLTWGGND